MAIRNHANAFHGANSGEGPAAAAVTLILDWLHNAGDISPVDSVSLRLTVEWVWLFGSLVARAIYGLEFLLGPGRELVVAEGEGVGRINVFLLDECISLRKQ